MVCYEMCLYTHTLYKLTVLSLWAKIFTLSNIIVIIYGNTSSRVILLYIKWYKIRIMFFFLCFFSDSVCSQNYYFIFVKQYSLQIINRFKVLIKKCQSICNILVDKIQHTLICLSDER